MKILLSIFCEKAHIDLQCEGDACQRGLSGA